MPTNDERREVARRLRDNAGQKPGWVIPWAAFNDAYEHEGAELLNRLASLIEPEERTCHMVRANLTDTVFCDVCGERFDGVARYMAMVPNGFSLADCKAKYKDAKFCPNCGAKVVGE